MKLFILLILTQFTINILAQEDFKVISNQTKIKSDFENKAIQLSSIKSDFIQEKHLAYLSSTVTSKGKFWYQKQDKLRWEYNEPFRYKVIINNGRIKISDENSTQVYDKKPNKTFDQLNRILSQSVNGKLIGDPNYSFEIFENTDQYLVKILPNNTEMKDIFTGIHLYFFKANLAVSKVKMIEKNEDTITITFVNKKVNVALDNNLFKID